MIVLCHVFIVLILDSKPLDDLLGLLVDYSEAHIQFSEDYKGQWILSISIEITWEKCKFVWFVRTVNLRFCFAYKVDKSVANFHFLYGLEDSDAFLFVAWWKQVFHIVLRDIIRWLHFVHVKYSAAFQIRPYCFNLFRFPVNLEMRDSVVFALVR